MKPYENGRILTIVDNNNYSFKANGDYALYNHIYVRTNESTGEKEYLTIFPDTNKVGDLYAVGDFLYTYTANGWKMEIITDGSELPSDYSYSGKTLEEYPRILNKINGGNVTDVRNAFAGCTNLKEAPYISSNANDWSGAFDGCTSLKKGTDITSNVTNVTNMYRGCTSLEGKIEIYSENITEYAGCFEGVDMSKITLTGYVSNTIKNKLGSTGLNYVMLPED